MTLEEAFENITDARIERCKKHNGIKQLAKQE